MNNLAYPRPCQARGGPCSLNVRQPSFSGAGTLREWRGNTRRAGSEMAKGSPAAEDNSFSWTDFETVLGLSAC